MILNYHAKNQLKWTSGSWDIQFSKIERSDWPRAFLAISQELNLPRTWFLATRSKIIPSNYICNIKKIVRAVFEKKKKKKNFLGLRKNGRKHFFFENRALSLFLRYHFLTPCKKSEKNNEPILRKLSDRLTDRLTDWQTRVNS